MRERDQPYIYYGWFTNPIITWDIPFSTVVHVCKHGILVIRVFMILCTCTCMCVHADMCDQGDVALTSNGNNDTIIVTFVNTTSGQTSEVSTPLSYRYVPTSETCGQHFELCNTIALTSENQTVVILPLNGSVGFVLRNSELDSNDSLQWHTVSPEIQACVFITFVPVDTNRVVGYCLKLGILYVFDVTFSYTSLDLSRIQPRIVGDMYQLGISANRTNFIYFDNNPSDTISCFSTELPYVYFLLDNSLIEHSFGDGFTELGTILSSATCTKLQRVGDCALAAYCGREVFTFLIDDDNRENFTPTLVSLPDEGGLVLLCSSNYLVYIRNSSLTLYVYDSNTWSPLSDPTYTQLDEEDIVRGNCYSPEIESTTFVVTLHATNSSLFLYRVTLLQQDSSTATVNITDITHGANGGHMGSDMVVTRTTSQYALVSNGINTTIFNWALPCYESPLVIPSAFTFVSFFTTGSMYSCSCSSSTTTSTNPTSPTIATTISSTTIHPTTPSSTRESSPSSDSSGNLGLIIGSYVLGGTALLLIIIVIVYKIIHKT